MSKNRPSGICKPVTPSKSLENMEAVFGPFVFGPTEIDVRRRLAECLPPFNPAENEAVWGPVRTIFKAFAEAEIARARRADTPDDSPRIILSRRAADYTAALARLEQVREESGMYGQAAEWSEINRTITDLESTYRRLARLDQPSQSNPSQPSQPKPKPKPKTPRPFSAGGGKGGRRTRRRKGTTRHHRKKHTTTYKTYRKSTA